MYPTIIIYVIVFKFWFFAIELNKRLYCFIHQLMVNFFH